MKDLLARASLFLFFGLNTLADAGAETTVGPWNQGRRSTYRYVTEYTVKKVKVPLVDFPWIEEDCHDTGNRFANWVKSISYEIRYGGALNFSLLGFLEIDLGGDRSRTVEFTFQRWVTPTEGLRARHRLMENYEIWEGLTYIETQTAKGIQRSSEPYPFLLEKANYGISVDREVLEICSAPKSNYTNLVE